MKIIKKVKSLSLWTLFLFTSLLIIQSKGFAQGDSTVPTQKTAKPPKPVKNTFPSVWIIDNQTVMVPIKKTLEMDFQHRFGVMKNGYQDMYGLFAPANIRLAANYVPIDRLSVGIGITKSNLTWDANVKYAIITQTPEKYFVSVTYFGDMAIDTRSNKDGSLFKYWEQRFSYFHQIIIARKINDKLSIQVAPSLSHQNSVNGYYTKVDSTGNDIYKEMNFNHFAVSVAARYKLTNVTSLIFNYDQPLTQHPSNNPNPNLSMGFEFNTSGHTFQVFFGNYYYLSPQRNNLYNTNSPFPYKDYTKTHPDRYTDDPNTTEDESVKVHGYRFLIGFNITRLWNY